MSTRLKAKQEKILQVITRLVEASARGEPIVVEGKKDSDALRELGVSGIVLSVKTGGKTFLEAITEIENMCACEVILLLDFDRRGKQGTLHLQQNLERAKIKVHLHFWRDLKALAGRDIQCIESLPSYLSTLEKKAA